MLVDTVALATLGVAALTLPLSTLSPALQLPDNVSMVDAAALATVGIAATQVFSYIDSFAFTPGATMLVNGGGSRWLP